MAEEIREEVKVMALFGRSMRPVRFKWRGRVYHVREITHRWASREGGADTVHFSVTDGSTLFELSYNRSTLRWSLEEVEA